MKANLEVLTVGGGCFWCIEAIFQQLKGVEKVVSGYSGGNCPGYPTYREVCSGRTGHAEVAQVTYDPTVVPFEELLVIFMTSHDPTTPNQQGADIGTQYRSAIFYHDETQKIVAEKVTQELRPYFANTIVTELLPLKNFYEAEEYHQNYYNENGDAAYCRAVISPKIAKLRSNFADNVKSAAI